VFLAAVSGFTIASMLCGAATSLNEMVVFRLLQGAFGAGLVPLSQAVLLDTYPRERHASAMAMWGVGVMVGPILGPTLGGYLTEVYNWRWVFYINLPFGLLALLGILSFVPETARDRGRPLDWFGFTLLSLAIGTLQLMLDRGQSQDWFTSSEIIIESVLSALFLYLFVVHMLTHRRPFLEPGLFRDRNFSIGLVFIFVVGIILLATLALLPPFLQNLMGYPVVTTGFVLAPRGVGTMIAMLLVGRLSGKVDPRAMILAGLCLTAVSLWEMSQFTLQVDAWSIVRTGVTQGLGLGFIFVPLSTITFATLRPQWRNEGTAMFSLMRNIGSSIGISVMVTLLARNTQANHALLSDQLTPFNSALQAAGHAWAPDTLAGMLALNSEVTRQAAAIAYLSDFRMMMWVTLLALPLLALLRKPSHPVAVEPD
jgi:DHA2 family multidrug resistance protein